MKTLFFLLHLLFSSYAERALALHAQGTLGFVGIAKETTWGTAVNATDFFEIMSENIGLSIDRFPTRNAFGGFYEPRDYAGMRRNAGDLVMFGHPVSVGHLLKAAFNTQSITVVLSGFLFRHQFSTVKSEFVDGGSAIIPSVPYTLEVHRDVTSSQRIVGAVCNRLSLSLAPNQDLRVTAGWIAKSFVAGIARTAPTFPGSPVHPFTFETASVQIDGAANTRFESFNMVINNNLNGIPRLNNSNEIGAIRRSDAQNVRISGVLAFENITELEDFVNQTDRALKLSLTRASSFHMLIDVPSFNYTAFPLGIPGRDRLTVGFDGMAQYNVGSGLAVDIGLTTTKSNY
jgi:hypothetical protein